MEIKFGTSLTNGTPKLVLTQSEKGMMVKTFKDEKLFFMEQVNYTEYMKLSKSMDGVYLVNIKYNQIDKNITGEKNEFFFSKSEYVNFITDYFNKISGFIIKGYTNRDKKNFVKFFTK